MYNLNTKKSLIEEDGHMIWVSGSFGSHTSCLYPDTVLKGDRSTCEFTGITFAGKGQYLDTGSKSKPSGRIPPSPSIQVDLQGRRHGHLPGRRLHRTESHGDEGLYQLRIPDAR